MSRRLQRLALAVLACAMLAGCASAGYYWQSLRGHWALLHAARPLSDWVAEAQTPPPLRERLALALRVRRFASSALALPDNASYTRYAQLKRSAAVWNVVAAPPYSLSLHTWCFAIVGCVGYRGYFDEADARAEAARLAASGLETSVYGVPAYSTLGYSNWLGGDPLLSTWANWPEGDFVRLMLHELAHQQVYAAGDTAFNESYATAVGRLGTQLWLAEHADAAARAAWEVAEQRRSQWRELTRTTRERLAEIYKQKTASAQASQALQAMKKEVFTDFAADYARLRAQWQAQGSSDAQLAALDRWVREANNASFAAQGAYDDLVPAFIALFEEQGRDWPRFHAAVAELAALTQSERHARLQALMPLSRAATQ
ncbi:aminopeptidase [Comamonas sp. NLF-1-9]|uniref:aminopeptidase n=1 Tax=Comamonas sp. NLF-1-9 TaxID=2853163 RepID=UPI001C4373A4|nr:aminopeptidase [Comamonas sp. NLF-1-9]QXL84189.1 aminopeptidase [Comamonas sp. NLF-1-9]